MSPPASLRTFRVSSWLVALIPLACAVATEPDGVSTPIAAEHGGSGGNAGTLPVVSSAGTMSSESGMTGGVASGGVTSNAGTMSAAGNNSSGRGGTTAATGGKPSGGSGGGPQGSAGMAAGGAAGSGGTSTGTGCTGLKTWKGGDSTLQIEQGEVIQWMGKRYKATKPIEYPNTECVPTAPVLWCADWFTADGSC